MGSPTYDAHFDTVVATYHSRLEEPKSLWLPEVIPLIAISGSRGKSTVACMLAAIMRSANRTTGAWLSSGVFAYGERLEGELGPWQKVLLAARHGELDLAIQEMSASTVVAVGLPPATYPMAVFTTICGNNEACLLAAETRTERKALDKVLRSMRTDGLIVAGVDDFDVAEAVDTSAVARALFALRKENPVLERHLQAGGTGGWIDDDHICVGRLDRYDRVVRVDDIPATLGGTLVFQMQNALAAALAARSVNVETDAIARALAAFSPDPEVQPAACNIIAYNGARVIVDAPHQIWSLRMLMRGIRNLPRRRTMVVSGVFPALPLEDVAEAGRLLGTLGAIVVLHADDDSVERLDALRTGISTAPTLPLVIQVHDELQAIDTMLNKVGPEDVALVLASNPGRALEHLWPRARDQHQTAIERKWFASMNCVGEQLIDFHTHTFHSDGSLSPMELVRRAIVNGYGAIGITDHVGMGGVAELLALLRAEREIIEKYWPIRVIVGVELTHVPAAAISDAAAFAREHGAELVVVHGETPVEPVPEGTNRFAINSGLVDILAHPGLLTEEDARAAARTGTYLEITSRRGHSLTNGHVQLIGTASGANLLVNSDSHDPGDLLTPVFRERVALGAGIAYVDLENVLSRNPMALLDRALARRT